MFFDRFTDTIFLKESSNLQTQYEALLRLKNEYPDNKDIVAEFYNVRKGLEGEKEIRYQLSKCNLGLYVLHDVNIEYEDLTAQIDYVVISKAYCYFIECKNLIGDITVNEKGNFIREYEFNGKKERKGMSSPVRQVEAQRDTFKKIWNNALSKNKIINNLKRSLSEKNFTDTYRVLVVAANNEGILDTKNAPEDIKYKVIKADSLIRKIEYDLNHSDKELWCSKFEMEKWAYAFVKMCVAKSINYYEFYKQKYVKEDVQEDNKLEEKLVELRKTRSERMNLPAYYVFNNEELKKILDVKPKNIEELKNILPAIKVKVHGEEIIKVINNK